MLAGVLALRLVNRAKENGWNAWQTARFTAFVVLVGVLIWVEFALDKSNVENSILYIVMTAALIAMGVAVLYEGQSFRSGEHEKPLKHRCFTTAFGRLVSGMVSIITESTGNPL